MSTARPLKLFSIIFLCISLLLSACSNKPTQDYAIKALEKNFVYAIEVSRFEYINGYSSEADKVKYYKMYFDGEIKFVEDWVDDSPLYRGKTYKKGDRYKISYAQIDFMLTDEGWRASQVGFKASDGFKKVVLEETEKKANNGSVYNQLVSPSYSSTAKMVAYPGKLIDEISWNDSNGNNCVIISKKTQGIEGEPDSFDQLFASCYLNDSKSMKKLWQIQDKSQNLASFYYIPGSLKTNDIDNNGVNEVVFAYQELEDGEGPIPLKLMMFSGSQKFPIRGTYCPIKGMCNENKEIKIGNEFSATTIQCKRFAVNEWNTICDT